jgi:hypothetical protein
MRRLAISSGHGLKIARMSDYLVEVDEAIKVMNRTAEYLEVAGVPVETWTDTTSTNQDTNLKTICDWHNKKAAPHDIDCSIHFNASQHTSNPVGTECWYVSQKELAAEVCKIAALLD